MKNIAQTPQDAKQAYLNQQPGAKLVTYQNADRNERSAFIRQIDSFLPITRSKDEKNFWLKFRQKLERLNEK